MQKSILFAAALALVSLSSPLNCLAQPGGSEQLCSEQLSEALISYAKLDYRTALRRLEPLAYEGDAVAQEVLGFMFLHGEGVSQDDTLAFGWFKLAAEQKRLEAQLELAKMYLNGVGTEINQTAALQWFHRAAELGNVQALEALAEHYSRQPDRAPAALDAYLTAAERGSAKAMHAIGHRYAKGLDVIRDDIEALKWFDLAYNQAIGSFRGDVARARSSAAERLMPAQVQRALYQAHQWWATHINIELEANASPQSDSRAKRRIGD